MLAGVGTRRYPLRSIYLDTYEYAYYLHPPSLSLSVSISVSSHLVFVIRAAVLSSRHSGFSIFIVVYVPVRLLCVRSFIPVPSTSLSLYLSYMLVRALYSVHRTRHSFIQLRLVIIYWYADTGDWYMLLIIQFINSRKNWA